MTCKEPHFRKKNPTGVKWRAQKTSQFQQYSWVYKPKAHALAIAPDSSCSPPPIPPPDSVIHPVNSSHPNRELLQGLKRNDVCDDSKSEHWLMLPVSQA